MIQHYRHSLWGIGVLALMLIGCAGQQASPGATAESAYRSPSSIEATGIVVPEKWTTISSSVGGTVIEVPVSDGDQILRNRILVYLDDDDARRAVDLAQIQVSEAEVSVRLAENELNRVVTWSPNKNQVAAAEASVNNAEAALEQAQSNFDKVAWVPGASASPQSLQLEQATNSYDVAKSNLDYLYSNRPDVKKAADQLELTELTLKEAELNQEIAEANLDKMIVRSPFEGTIGQVLIREKQVITPGMPIMTIADLATLRVETTDLNENDVVNVAVGDVVTVTFEALPGVEVEGTVIKIGVKAEEGVGVNYTVTVELSKIPEAIRWGMTAYVNFPLK
ncbi:MAG: efflux RND transporter periplasmic adaptor subunit [Anaerolineae bacterium]|nr:efflux RND transporter periplasmic adaptor subunit [Anaerolineae bacterium]